MRRLLLSLALFLAPVAPATAQQMVAEYYAWISPQDMVNSRGVRLTNWCAIIQQDRANYHRFGRRDDLDDPDPVFGSRAARAAMAGRCVLRRGSEYIGPMLQRGETRYVWVRIFFSGGQLFAVEVGEGAG